MWHWKVVYVDQSVSINYLYVGRFVFIVKRKAITATYYDPSIVPFINRFDQTVILSAYAGRIVCRWFGFFLVS